MRRPIQIKWIHLRRFSQIIFLLFFLWLFLAARDPLQKTIPPDLLLRLDPLAGLSVSLATRGLVQFFWPALIIILLTLALGRSFCGWICPLGTSLDLWNRLVPSGQQRGNRRWKFALLLSILLLAPLGVQAAWLLDPLIIFNRSLAVALYPLSAFGMSSLLNAAFGSKITEGAALWISDRFQGWFLPTSPLQTALLTSTLLIFAAILLLNLFGRRYWCRVLCPLGALLGLVSHLSPFGRKVSEECTSCTLCSEECRMGAIETDFMRTRRAECILCLECREACAADATTYTWGLQTNGQEHLDLGRRRVIGSLSAAVALGGVWRTGLKDRAAVGRLVRPPGSVAEEKFLDLCLRCQECVKACSSTGRCLQPSSLEFGWESLWTPAARMREGYCEFACTLCGQVCPSGAIKSLTEANKKIRVIGLAFIDRSRCIPWFKGEDCIVCEEHCPLPKKAIIFRAGSVEMVDRAAANVKLPYVDYSLCIGCGVCETKCPLAGESAIRITNEGEQREV